MIVHKVPRKQRRQTNRSVRARAVRLGLYIFDAHVADDRKLSLHEDQSYLRSLTAYAAAPEKVLGTSARNFRSDDFGDQLAQMDELLSGVGSSADRVDHWVLSWDPSDDPTNDEMLDAFAVLNRCLGIEGCPSLVGIHGNTGNPHGHQAVLRVDPVTGAPIRRPFDGWDIDAAHRALAVIEDRYPHWKVCPDRTYEVRNGRVVHRSTAADVGAAADPSSWIPLNRSGRANQRTSSTQKHSDKIDAASVLYEEDTGWKSRKRVALEEAVPALLSATGWADAHGQLAELGLALDLAKNKSGANFIIDDKKVKASIDDRTSLAKLQKRWGPFQPCPDHLTVAAFSPRPMFPGDVERARYYAEKRAFVAGLARMIAEVRSAEKGYRSSVPFSRCDPTQLMRLSFPSLEEWRMGAAAPDVAQVLAGASQVAGLSVDTHARPVAYNIMGYEARDTPRGVAYRKTAERYARPAVFDAGQCVYVNDGTDASITVALRILQARYPGQLMKPFGSPEFIARVERIAATENILVATTAYDVEATASNRSGSERYDDAAVDGQERPPVPANKLPGTAVPEISAQRTKRPPDPRASYPSGAPKPDAKRSAIKPDATAAPADKTREQQRPPVKPDPRVEAAKAAAALAAQMGRG